MIAALQVFYATILCCRYWLRHNPASGCFKRYCHTAGAMLRISGNKSLQGLACTMNASYSTLSFSNKARSSRDFFPSNHLDFKESTSVSIDCNLNKSDVCCCLSSESCLSIISVIIEACSCSRVLFSCSAILEMLAWYMKCRHLPPVYIM